MARRKNNDPPPEAPPPAETPRPGRVAAVKAKVQALQQQFAVTEPLLDKLTAEQISVIIAHIENDSKRAYEERLARLQERHADRRHARIFWSILAGLALLAFVGVWIGSLAYGKPDLVLELIKWLGGLFGGAVGGYGLRGAGSSKRNAKARRSTESLPPG